MKLNFEDLIVFENEDYILINKPPHVASLDERTTDRTGISILRMAKEYHADAQLGHRLDKETSGILAIARNPEAYRHLAPATISDWKRAYREECEGCSLKAECGGFFEWHPRDHGYSKLGAVQ